MILTGVFIYLAAWLEQSFALTEMQIGFAFSLGGVGGLIGNPLTAILTDREEEVILVGYANSLDSDDTFTAFGNPVLSAGLFCNICHRT
jgi:predicted MFS family arabinose efflux permease